MEIAKQHPPGDIQWETRLAEAFNEYRAKYSPVQADEDGIAQETEPEQRSSPEVPKTEEQGTESLALEAFALINEAREENGLHAVEPDEELMELARMRVPELEEQYSHARPDGTRMSRAYRCGEIINRGASTPQLAVESWLGSPAHREMILDERYHSAGIACHQGADGVTYWCMLFRK